MSTVSVSLDSGHQMTSDTGYPGHMSDDPTPVTPCPDLEAMRKRLRFRHTVSEVSRNTMSEISEDDGKQLIYKTKLLNSSNILGGRRNS